MLLMRAAAAPLPNFCTNTSLCILSTPTTITTTTTTTTTTTKIGAANPHYSLFLKSSGSSSRVFRRHFSTKRASSYVRKPTGTPGAYHLIDEETGEKFIVWGGADDAQDSPIPSKKVLSWNPKTNASDSGDSANAATVAAKTTTLPHGGDNLSRSFGRLKALNVRKLVKKVPPRNLNLNLNNNEQRSTLSSRQLPEKLDTGSDFHVKKSKSDIYMEDRQELSTNRQEQYLSDQREMDLEGDEEVISQEDHGATAASQGNPSRLGSKEGKFEAKYFGSSKAPPSLRRWDSVNATDDYHSTTRSFNKHKKVVSNGDFFSRSSFRSLRCSDDMIQALTKQDILVPSHIQALAYVPVYEGKSCIIAEQSGSGKTLAYLCPVVQRLKTEESQGLVKRLTRSPRVIVLVPTAELASQVLLSCRSVSKYGVPFKSMVATGGFKQRTQSDNLEDVDVLIATPGRFMFLLHEGFLHLSNLSCVVLDEVDVLFNDDGFQQTLQYLIASAQVSVQYLFVTATLPIDIYNKVVEIFPDCKAILGPGLHHVNSRLEEVLVDCSGGDDEEKSPESAFLNKRSALLRIMKESPVRRTVIFCNKIETCRKVENVLVRFDRKAARIQALPFHAAVNQDLRLSNMQEFLNSESEDSLFLICTDRASRGIDFSQVEHVILFDFPRDPSEYVRRVGRTARGSNCSGTAFVLVVGKQVSLARRIIERNRKGYPVHPIPSSYELEGRF